MVECVRAVLVTPSGRMLLIRRTWPGAAPYWVFPGGHVEPDDADLQAALAREVREETGAQAQFLGLLRVLSDEHVRQHFFLGWIQSWSEAERTGPEFDDPDRGEYRLEEIALTVEALDAITLEPEEIAVILRDAMTSGASLVSLLDPVAG